MSVWTVRHCWIGLSLKQQWLNSWIFLTDVIDCGRIGSSRGSGKILCLWDIPGLGMVPLYQGRDERGTNWHRVVHCWAKFVTIQVDSKGKHERLQWPSLYHQLNSLNTSDWSINWPIHVDFANIWEEKVKVVGVTPLHQGKNGACVLQSALQDCLCRKQNHQHCLGDDKF